nr:response regulator [Gemmatimonadales bacterium]
GDALSDLTMLLRRLIGEKVKLEVVHGRDLWPVKVDISQFEQVIVNLAVNARDAMPEGGKLTIETCNAHLDDAYAASTREVRPGQYVCICVSDTGTGMTPDVIARAFDPFFTTKPVGKGTGLGLAAVDGIMRQNGGYITAASAAGLGATFTLYLPVLSDVDVVERRGGPRGEPLPPGPDEKHAGAIVLLVEDEPAVRAIAARSLERAGFRVLQASGGGEALEVVDQQGQPDLLLTDLMMPGIGGAELARRLKVRWPELPILFMSGYSIEDLVRQGAIGSERTILQKPFTPDGLVRSVAGALAQKPVSG